MLQQKTDIIRQLQRDILPLQGFRPLAAGAARIGLGAIENAFPNNSFPTGAIHECISTCPEAGAATGGFIAAVAGALTKNGGACVWAGTSCNIFPPALKTFGIEPEHIIFIVVQKEKDVLWVMEEALKCEGLAAVIGEIKEIDFKTSRRLQLAVEHSRATGFILRNSPRQLNTVASVARWKITPLASAPADGMPGVGLPRWKVQLLKVRNGKPGTWETEWAAGKLHIVEPEKQTVWIDVLPQYGSAI